MNLRAAMMVSQALLSSASLLIPQPVGPYGTDVVVTALTDHSRLNPFAPRPENISTVISIFYPVAPVSDCEWKEIPAYPKVTAQVFDEETAFAGVPNGSFERVRLQVCASSSQPKLNTTLLSNAPIVFFSPGLGLSRLWYSALAQSVASFGYNIVTVDTPYDADIVEYPDGRIIRAINSTWNTSQSLLDVRVRAQDISFVLDELSKSEVVEMLFPGTFLPAGAKLSTAHAGVFGHSIGGATAAMSMYMDPRMLGGVNLDGGLYGPVIQEGLSNPFILFAHKEKGVNSNSETWVDIWPHLDWKLEIEIKHSTHTTFTDIPLLADLIFGQPLPPFVEGVVGKIPGPRARDVVTAYVVALMNSVLKCAPQSLLQRPSPEYAEIEFVGVPKVH